MNDQQAEKAIITSALLVAGIYTYRRVTEGSGTSGAKTAQLLGQGSPPSAGVFITAWGAAFLIMSLIAQVAPGVGGGFAILAATGDLLSNGQQVFTDISTKTKTKTATNKAPATTPQTGALPTNTLFQVQTLANGA